MPGFLDDIYELEHPIDVMYLMHKVYMKHSESVENLSRSTQNGGDFELLAIQLTEWLDHIYYHTDTEDLYMTGPLKDKELHDGRMPLKENVIEHDIIRDSGKIASDSIVNINTISPISYFSIKDVLSMEEKNHEILMTKVNAVETELEKMLGASKLDGTFRRHLYNQIVALKVAEYDHFENEEAFVLPMIKDQMTKLQQLECVEKLLFDEKSENSSWIYDFIETNLNQREADLLISLKEEINKNIG